MSNKEIISLAIDRLKFPLICGVVFIHNQLKGDISISGQSLYTGCVVVRGRHQFVLLRYSMYSRSNFFHCLRISIL